MRLAKAFCVLFALSAGRLADAAAVSPELQRLARGAVYEVVLPKQEADRLSYDKPLPVDLLPFAERTDKYRQIGNAFALDDHTFVSAALVMLQGVGSEIIPPLLRDSAGKLYEVANVVKYSQREDFMVFTVASPASPQPLQVRTDAKLDDQVYAAGYLANQGLTVRDGLITAELPEQQDGSWKWLRTSAAGAIGISGGPLLDQTGKVIGLLPARLTSGSLGSALPISRVIEASTKIATFGERSTFALPLLKDKITVTMDATIALPKSYAEFGKEYRALLNSQFKKSSEQLLATAAASLWPKGKSQKLLTELYADFFPKVIAQNAEGEWEAQGYAGAAIDYGNGGSVQSGSSNALAGYAVTSGSVPDYLGSGGYQPYSAGFSLFRIRRPDRAADAAFYADTELAGKLLLMAQKLPRTIGGQTIQVSSLGQAAIVANHKDKFGRQWHMRAWPLGYMDAWVTALMLPTPDGYVGMVGRSAGLRQEITVSILEQAADYFYFSYAGTVPQWQAYLARADLRARSLDSLQLTGDLKKGLRVSTPRFTVALPGANAKLADWAVLDIWMNYIVTGDRLAWDISGLRVEEESAKKAKVVLVRAARPGEEAGKAALQRWQSMLGRAGGYNNIAAPDASMQNYTISAVLDSTQRTVGGIAPGSQVLYQLSSLTDQMLLPRELSELQSLVIEGVRILEK
jgi:hypothetical protein